MFSSYGSGGGHRTTSVGAHLEVCLDVGSPSPPHYASGINTATMSCGRTENDDDENPALPGELLLPRRQTQLTSSSRSCRPSFEHLRPLQQASHHSRALNKLLPVRYALARPGSQLTPYPAAQRLLPRCFSEQVQERAGRCEDV